MSSGWLERRFVPGGDARALFDHLLCGGPGGGGGEVVRHVLA